MHTAKFAGIAPAVCALALLTALQGAAADDSAGGELYRTIAALDSALFESYNHCDLEKNRTFFADDLEFYHDQSGLTVGADRVVEQIRENICGKTRRELVPGSMHVYEIKGYGAVQMGSHRFFTPIDAKQPSGEAKFVHIWRRSGGQWKITRVISYDHHAASR